MIVAVMKEYSFDLEDYENQMIPTGFSVMVGDNRYPLFKGGKGKGAYKLVGHIVLARVEDYKGTKYEGVIE